MSLYPVDIDEWYPFFSLMDPSDNPNPPWSKFTIELSDEDHADYERVMAEFYAWHERFGAAREAAGRVTP